MSNLPTKEQILAWISDNPGLRSKRDLSKAFGIKGADRIELKRMLRELEADGHLEKRGRTYRDPEKLPPVGVLIVQAPDSDGDLFARPMNWDGDGPEPRVLYTPRQSGPSVGEGDRILAKLFEAEGEDYGYTAKLIRKIGTNPRKILGVFRRGRGRAYSSDLQRVR